MQVPTKRSLVQVAAAAVLCSLMNLAGAQAAAEPIPPAAPANATGSTPDARPAAAAGPEGRMLAERFVKPSAGAVALVFNEQGEAIAVTRDGKVLPPCQICTPELERIYGPKCTRARKASEALSTAGASTPGTAAAAPPLICNKLMDTTVQAVSPISMVRHTGSQCMTFFFNNGGKLQVSEYCW